MMKASRCFPYFAAVVLLLSLFPGFVFSQANNETFEEFQFNFATPGARAAAMGRAFIGLADDASSAVTNPAGLLNLRRAQVYAEFKSTDFSVLRAARPDAYTSGQGSEFGERVNYLSFFNVAVPLGDSVSLAFTRHEYFNYKENFSLSARPVPGLDGLYALPAEGTNDFQGESYAGSIAVAPHERFKIGLTFSYDRLKAKTDVTRFNIDNTGQETDIIDVQTDLNGTDNAMGFKFGLLATPVDGTSIGFVYDKGSKFEYEQNFTFNVGQIFNPPVNGPYSHMPDFPTNATFKVPDRIGAGVSVRPQNLPRLMILADVVHIRYSQMVDDFLVIYHRDYINESDYKLDSKTEFHFGGEFAALAGRNSIFLRGGLFTNPGHPLRWVGNTGVQEIDLGETARFNTLDRGTDIGGTFGGGVALGRHFQADLAYIISDVFKEFVVSVAVRF